MGQVRKHMDGLWYKKHGRSARLPVRPGRPSEQAICRKPMVGPLSKNKKTTQGQFRINMAGPCKSCFRAFPVQRMTVQFGPPPCGARGSRSEPRGRKAPAAAAGRVVAPNCTEHKLKLHRTQATNRTEHMLKTTQNTQSRNIYTRGGYPPPSSVSIQ